MSSILPIKISYIETYMCDAFIQGIVASHDILENELFNSYVNLRCDNVSDLKEINIHYTGVSWEDFRKRGLAEMNLFSFSNIPRDNCIAFLDERISQGCYILLYKIDEYYLSYSKYYRVKHFIHDTYIYGYDEEHYYVMAYRGHHLDLFKVQKNEILDGLYRPGEEEGIVDFCTFRPAIVKKIRANKRKFQKGLEYFLQGEGEYQTNHIYGIKVYDILKNCTYNEIENSHLKNPADVRGFRMLWEQKRLLCAQINRFYSQNEQLDNEYLMGMKNIEELAHRIFKLSLKYNVIYKAEILERIIQLVDMLSDMEKEVYGNVLGM